MEMLFFETNPSKTLQNAGMSYYYRQNETSIKRVS